VKHNTLRNKQTSVIIYCLLINLRNSLNEHLRSVNTASHKLSILPPYIK